MGLVLYAHAQCYLHFRIQGVLLSESDAVGCCSGSSAHAPEMPSTASYYDHWSDLQLSHLFKCVGLKSAIILIEGQIIVIIGFSCGLKL